MSQYLTTIGGTYAKNPIVQSSDADFSWVLEMFDGDDDTDPSDLTGREFSFEVFDLAGNSLEVYEIGTGIVVHNSTGPTDPSTVTVTIQLEDWAAWRKNCHLTYKYKMVLDDGTRRPLFSDTFTLVA